MRGEDMNTTRFLTARQAVRSSATVAALIVGSFLLTGCANWWVPEVPQGQSGGVGDSSAEVALMAPQVLGGTVTSLPEGWNATAAANGSGVVLPDAIVADETVGDASTSALALGDYAMQVQWNDASGELEFIQVDGPMEAPAGTSDMAVVGESLVAGALGLSPPDAKTFVQDLIAAAEAEATDPNSLFGSAVSGSSTVTFTMDGGAGMVIVTAGE
jgi:hypothetical protein